MQNPFHENLISIHILSFLNAKDALQFALCNHINHQYFQKAIQEQIISPLILTKAVYRNRFQSHTYCKIVHYNNTNQTLSYKLLPYSIHRGSGYPILNKWELLFTPIIHYHPFVLSIHSSFSHFYFHWYKMTPIDLQYRLHITYSYILFSFLYRSSIFLFYTLQFLGIIGLFLILFILSFQPFSNTKNTYEPIIFHLHPNFTYIDHLQDEYCSLPFPFPNVT
jgi:hypothetical protein